MTGVGWVQWTIDGLFFTAGLLIGALVLHEAQMWRAMRRRGGMLEDFRMGWTVNPQPFEWAWPQVPTASGYATPDSEACFNLKPGQLNATAEEPRLRTVPPNTGGGAS